MSLVDDSNQDKIHGRPYVRVFYKII